ncbi:unnamed protein product, partial [Ectocarpus sp. 12 AP-2014]
KTSDVDFLFGLDMLKRHLCVIDLKSSTLGLGSAGASVPFLSEKDLPSSARETQASRYCRIRPAAAAAVGSAAAGAGGAEEAKVTQLTAMGFSREQAEGALS